MPYTTRRSQPHFGVLARSSEVSDDQTNACCWHTSFHSIILAALPKRDATDVDRQKREWVSADLGPDVLQACATFMHGKR